MSRLIVWTGATPNDLRREAGHIIGKAKVKHKIVKINRGLPKLKKGDVCLAMGTKAVTDLAQLGMVPKNRKVGSLRGDPIQCGKGVLFITFDPKLPSIDIPRKTDIMWDTHLAIRYLKHQTTVPRLGDYKYVTSFTKAIKKIKKLRKKFGVVPISIDLETVGLDPIGHDKFIVSISITFTEGKSHVIRFKSKGDPLFPAIRDYDEKGNFVPFLENEELWDQMQWLATATDYVKVYGANFKYDMGWMLEHWGIQQWDTFRMDTTIVGSLLDENRCVGLDTLLLTENLNWVKAKDIKEGDTLTGFDEQPPAPKGHRKIRSSEVLSTEIIQKPKLGLHLSNGVYLEVSDNHQLLKNKGGVYIWCKSKNLKVGHRLKAVTGNPNNLNSNASEYDLGRLSGFLDGDGSSHKINESGSWGLTWGQKPNVAHEDMKRIFNDIGINYREHNDAINVCKTVAAKGVWNSLQGMIVLKPLRLMEKKVWIDGSMPREPEPITIIKIDDLGVGSVVAIETTTHTFIAEGICSHNSNSLETHAKIYTNCMGGYDRHLNKTYDKGRMDLVPDGDLLTYAGGDTDAGLRVGNIFRNKLLNDQRSLNFYKRVMHPAVHAFNRIEHRGIEVDIDQYAVLKKEVQAEIDVMHKKVTGMFSAKTRAKFSDNLSLGRSVILEEFLFTKRGLNLKPMMFTEKAKKPSTAMEHFEMLAEKHDAVIPFLDAMRAYNSATKTMSTYINGFTKHLRDDGRFHPNYMLYKGAYGNEAEGDSGAGTGRTSARDPAYQCQPAWSRILTDKGYRTIGSVIGGLLRGEVIKVLSHDGTWRRAHTPHDNRVQAVYRVRFKSGGYFDATGNHPVLTEEGYINVSALQHNSRVFTSRGKNQSIPNVLQRTDKMHKPKMQGLPKVWRGRYKVFVGYIREFFTGYGRTTYKQSFIRTYRQCRELLQSKLQMGNSKGAMFKQKFNNLLHSQWNNFLYVGLGKGVRNAETNFLLPFKEIRTKKGDRIALQAKEAGYILDEVCSIEYLGDKQTYGISVTKSHSYITDGYVVSNTIPKHTKWAKPLRTVYVPPKGMCILNCIDKNTRVLTDTLKWVKAGDIKKGTKLVGFSEERPGKWKERIMNTTTVTNVSTKISVRYKLTLESGKTLIVSNDHRWLVAGHGKYKTALEFVKTEDLVPNSHKIRRCIDTWESEYTDYEAGYLSGILDGEGYINQSSGITLGVAQVDGLVWDNIKILTEKYCGFGSYEKKKKPKNKSHYKQLNVWRLSDMKNVLELLGRIRPVRLLNKKPWEGKALPRSGFDLIVKSEVIEVGEVVSISTDEKTFIAEGLCSHNCDYSQGELKVAACLANEKTMIDAYRGGMDLHSLTGSSVYGMTIPQLLKLQKKAKTNKKAADRLGVIRQGGKAGNFGLLYAMQAPGFRTYARTTYGVDLTAQESEDFRDAYFKRFTGLLPWHERTIQYAQKHHEVVSPLGRVRHLPLINSNNYSVKSKQERQAINATVQSTLSDLGLIAMGILNVEYPDLWMFGFTHDAISAYVPIEDAKLWGDRISDVMQNLPLEEYFGWKPQLQFNVDVEMGLNNMAQLDEIDKVLAMAAEK